MEPVTYIFESVSPKQICLLQKFKLSCIYGAGHRIGRHCMNSQFDLWTLRKPKEGFNPKDSLVCYNRAMDHKILPSSLG